VVGQLISGIAHEINNPLTAVVGYAELLTTSEENHSPELKEDLKFIYDNSVRCREIVSNLLRFVRKEGLKKKSIQINDAIRSSVQLMHFRVVKKEQIQLECDLAPRLPPISADLQQIEQVIVNLIHNACDALSEIKGPKKITVLSRFEDGRVMVQIKDNGPGIPSNIQEKIFDPFFTTKDEGKGTGLGLSICQRIIQDHGGSITVESVPGSGASFLVSLPVSHEKEPQKTEIKKRLKSEMKI
jgi:two-component system NtrC family sensor kinase